MSFVSVLLMNYHALFSSHFVHAIFQSSISLLVDMQSLVHWVHLLIYKVLRIYLTNFSTTSFMLYSYHQFTIFDNCSSLLFVYWVVLKFVNLHFVENHLLIRFCRWSLNPVFFKVLSIVFCSFHEIMSSFKTTQ